MDGNYQHAEHTYIFETLVNINRPAPPIYQLPDIAIKELLDLPDPFEGVAYRVSVFLQAYSRRTRQVPLSERPSRDKIFVPYSEGDGKQRKEEWTDVCVRVVQGVISFYADYLRKNMLPFPEDLDDFATKMLLSMGRMEWCPPGRGLFAMGTLHTFQNGNAALNNCYAVSTKDNLVKAAAWCMDMLMCGGGVGFAVDWRGDIVAPNKEDTMTFVVPDTRQGWVAALELLLRSYIPIDGKITNKFPVFDYSLVRPYGVPVKGFGGTSSGSDPLVKLLKRVEICLDAHLDWKAGQSDLEVQTRFLERLIDNNVYVEYEVDKQEMLNLVKVACEKIRKPYNEARLVIDLFNCVGQCVVAGNIRRSAEICIFSVGNAETMLQIKNWDLQPERRSWMHLSNNTLMLEKDEDFEKMIPPVADLIRENGEPGIANLISMQKNARMGDESYGKDAASLLNPCAEICLESYEPCCLSTINSHRLVTKDHTNKEYVDDKLLDSVCKFANFYSVVITTISNHWRETNQVIYRNRRIGVSLNGVVDTMDKISTSGIIALYRSAYKSLRKYNTELTRSLGIPCSLRLSCNKPEGTLSIVCGGSPGVNFSITRFGKRRVAFNNDSTVLRELLKANYPSEKSTLTANQTYIIFPIKSDSKRTAREASMFEKMSVVIASQRHYADNAVSATISYSPSKEGHLIEELLADSIGNLKAISMLPEFEGDTSQYAHMPFTEITKEEYLSMLGTLLPVDWNSIYYELREDADKSSTMYCTGDSCTKK